MTITYADVEPGTAIEQRTYRITRLDLVKYCGASGDFNVIHWNERVARSVLAVTGVWGDRDHAGVRGSERTAATYWRSDRS